MCVRGMEFPVGRALSSAIESPLLIDAEYLSALGSGDAMSTEPERLGEIELG